MFVKRKLTVLISLLCAGFLSCSSDSGNGMTGLVSLSVEGTAPGALAAKRVSRAAAATSVAVDVIAADGSVAGTLTLTDARLSLKEIELEMAEGEDDAEELEGEIEFPGPYVVNLLTDEVTPSLAEVELPEGRYEEIKLKLDKIEGDEEDEEGSQVVTETDPLFGNSIYLSGTYTSQDGSINGAAVTLTLDIDEEFELTGADGVSEGFEIDGQAEVNSIIIAFRMAKWFDFSGEEIDFTAVSYTSGAVDLNSGVDGDNQKIWEIVKENIKDSADYGKDKDGDGELGSDEDDDPDSEDSEDN